MKCSMSDEVDYVKMSKEKDEVSEKGEWFGIEPVSSIVGRAIVVGRNYPIKPVMHHRS